MGNLADAMTSNTDSSGRPGDGNYTINHETAAEEIDKLTKEIRERNDAIKELHVARKITCLCKQ